MTGNYYTLKTSLDDVECWNSSKGEKVSLEAGSVVRVCGPYGRRSRTVQFVRGSEAWDARLLEEPIRLPSGALGYRAIIPNNLLAEAIGEPVPEQEVDVAGELMRMEGGEMTKTEEVEFLKHLRDSGLARGLQGRYWRAIADLPS